LIPSVALSWSSSFKSATESAPPETPTTTESPGDTSPLAVMVLRTLDFKCFILFAVNYYSPVQSTLRIGNWGLRDFVLRTSNFGLSDTSSLLHPPALKFFVSFGYDESLFEAV
jgi:hypothetical protein